MPGDSVIKDYIAGVQTPELLFVIGILLILAYVAIKSLPMIKEIKMRKIDHEAEIALQRLENERKREERKAEEFQQEMERDRARTEVIGKQNEIQDTLARSIEGQSIQMATLISSLEESKIRSRTMSDKVMDTNTKVNEIHTMIVKAGK